MFLIFLGSALIFFHYKESPARPKEPKAPRTWESVRNTSLLAAGIGWTSGDCLLRDEIFACQKTINFYTSSK